MPCSVLGYNEADDWERGFISTPIGPMAIEKYKEAMAENGHAVEAERVIAQKTCQFGTYPTANQHVDSEHTQPNASHVVSDDPDADTYVWTKAGAVPLGEVSNVHKHVNSDAYREIGFLSILLNGQFTGFRFYFSHHAVEELFTQISDHTLRKKIRCLVDCLTRHLCFACGSLKHIGKFEGAVENEPLVQWFKEHTVGDELRVRQAIRRLCNQEPELIDKPDEIWCRLVSDAEKWHNVSEWHRRWMKDLCYNEMLKMLQEYMMQ